MELVRVWQNVMERLEQTLTPNDLACWAGSIRPRELCDGRFVADVPSRVHLEQVQARLGVMLGAALADETGAPVEIVLSVDSNRQTKTTASTVPVASFQSGYTFEAFVTGPSNEVAYRSARDVAEHPGERFNPLYLYGGVGLGKTHLMTAVANTVTRGARRRVTFLSAERFTNDLVGAFRTNAVTELRERLRKSDILIVDDVQFFAGKDRMQEEFLNTFNALYAAQKQIVLASDQPPQRIPNLEERLRNRFEAGLITDVRKPDLPLRLAILARKAAILGLELPAAVCQLIATRIVSSVRELEGALHRLAAACRVAGRTADVAFAAQVLQPMLRPPVPRTLEQVQRLVAERFRMTEQDLVRKQRSSRYVLPRQVAMYLARKGTSATYGEIAAGFGGRNHTTVMYAVKSVETRRAADSELAALLDHLETELAV